jgi:hypothetical protein
MAIGMREPRNAADLRFAGAELDPDRRTRQLGAGIRVLRFLAIPELITNVHTFGG